MIKLIFRQFEISISHITGECAIYHSIFLKFGRSVVLDKGTTWFQFQGRRIKVKVMSTHPWQICCTFFFSVIVQRISVKLDWYIESTSSINSINFQIRTPNIKVTVKQNRNVASARICKWHDILLIIAQYTLHTFFQRNNKPRHAQSMALDVWTKNWPLTSDPQNRKGLSSHHG